MERVKVRREAVKVNSFIVVGVRTPPRGLRHGEMMNRTREKRQAQDQDQDFRFTSVKLEQFISLAAPWHRLPRSSSREL